MNEASWWQWLTVILIPAYVASLVAIYKVWAMASAKIEQLSADLAALRLHVAENYATNEFVIEVRDEMRRGVEKLDLKLDRLLDMHNNRRLGGAE